MGQNLDRQSLQQRIEQLSRRRHGHWRLTIGAPLTEVWERAERVARLERELHDLFELKRKASCER